jgi:L-lactate dehydrogenase
VAEVKQLKRTRIVVVGTGFVGSTYAFALMGSRIADEIVLIDANARKAEGEAMDLNHAMAFSPPMRIWAGDYGDCHDADIVVMTAGTAQRPGETRMDLLARNAGIFREICGQIMASGFSGIIVVATNPVDVLSYVTWKCSGLPAARIIGSGTILDTARFRFLLGEYFDVDARNVHANIIGEHGDTELPVWSHADISGQAVMDLARSDSRYSVEDLDQVFVNVRDAAYNIIERKGATYYAIGMGLLRLTQAIVRNENAILTVSTLLTGQYGTEDVFIGVPAVVNREGVREVLELELDADESARFSHSAEVLKEAVGEVFPAVPAR